MLRQLHVVVPCPQRSRPLIAVQDRGYVTNNTSAADRACLRADAHAEIGLISELFRGPQLILSRLHTRPGPSLHRIGKRFAFTFDFQALSGSVQPAVQPSTR